MTSPKVRLWYALLVSFLACVVVAGSSVGYASWVNGQSRKRAAQAQVELVRVQQQQQAALCRMVVLMDDAWRETPPTSTAGRNLADAVAEARSVLGCPKR